jgi:phospholipid-binding lipoprotein MlaA
MRPVWFFSDKGGSLVNSSSKLLIAALALLIVSFFLPSGGGERLSLTSLSFQNSAFAATETTNTMNEEEPEPFKVTAKAEYAPDPLESLNRAFFVFNDKLYFWLLKPAAQIYGIFIPPGVRTCIRNSFDNLRFPSRFINNALQGKFKAAGVETGRFLINSTMGLGGLFEIASLHFDLTPPPDEDTGQTLAFYGLKPGFYIVWPVLGPSSLRDSFGLAGDTFLNPLYYLPYFTSVDWWGTVAIRAGMMVNNTSLRIGEYEDFKKAALDPYASMRQAYLQNRQNEILK